MGLGLGTRRGVKRMRGWVEVSSPPHSWKLLWKLFGQKVEGSFMLCLFFVSARRGSEFLRFRHFVYEFPDSILGSCLVGYEAAREVCP